MTDLLGAGFALGQTFTTPGVRASDLTEREMAELINRHYSGDWGDLKAADKQLNDQAVQSGGSILSCYVVRGTKYYVQTTDDRSCTVLMIPDEY